MKPLGQAWELEEQGVPSQRFLFDAGPGVGRGVSDRDGHQAVDAVRVVHSEQPRYGRSEVVPHDRHLLDLQVVQQGDRIVPGPVQAVVLLPAGASESPNPRWS